MKNIKYAIIAAVALLFATSCEEFLTREPINKFAGPTYFENESQLKMYCDGMINSWLPDNTDIGNNGNDVYTDLIASKTCTDFYNPGIWNNVKQGGWSWSAIRRVNYMLDNMERAKGNVDEKTYNHYEGVGRFWRAYTYFSRIRTFSDVPWLEHVVEAEDTLTLFGKRDDREFVFHKVVEDLEFATANCSADSKFHTNGRIYIDKYVVLAFASRFMLYEGTYRKNHSVNPATNNPWNNQYESADDLLRLAAKYAKEIIDSKAFKLHANYKELFLSENLQTDETIWGRTYSEELGARHELTRYYNSSTLGQQGSGTKFLVRQFLKTDGTPVLTGDQTINEEFIDRDARLSATVLGPGRKIHKLSGEYSDQNINFTFCKTGYMLVKWCIPDENNFQNSIDNNSLPILRYAEVLLNYAEAMKELGQFNEDIWNQTIGLLRARAGVKNIYPGSAEYVPDPWLRSYYTEDVAYSPNLDDIDLEIRRERVTELTLEGGLRTTDLYRWNQADLIERRYNHQGWPGLWVTADEAKNGFVFSGTTYKFTGTANKETIYPISDTNDLNWTLEPSGPGFLLVYNYKLEWKERMYVRPIPQSAINLNKNLGQNYGW
ncbi:MAG: RagB/SusD family nutrient uptake outer membrane protein [Bacteroidales bacterium]|nr:RagB/SusD family nutrient uptake outer membrane protein [Bacteroidales bacterium]